MLMLMMSLLLMMLLLLLMMMTMKITYIAVLWDLTPYSTVV
jgi:hypothetical protein